MASFSPISFVGNGSDLYAYMHMKGCECDKTFYIFTHPLTFVRTHTHTHH